MRIGFVGCGYTADGYRKMLGLYPQLELVGATDHNSERASKFCAFHSVKHFPDLPALLADSSIEMVINLTNSSSHYEVSKAWLEAGKHLYTEKPLATSLEQAKALAALAEAKGLYVSMAPCSLLGETAQTLWRALRGGAIGTPHLVYAELDDGPFHLAEPHTWRSPSGAPYEYHEEYRVGVAVEHSEYYMGWFTAFFGPAKSITAFSSVVWPTKPISPEETLHVTTPDFSVACVTFESGVVARLTCSLVAPFNHVMKIVGETGVLSIDECWNFSAPVHLDRYTSLKYRAERYPITKAYPVIPHLLDRRSRTYPPVWKSSFKNRQQRFRMDYTRGIAELARAITKKTPPRLPLDYCLHVTELALAIQNPPTTPYQVTTTFKPLEPLSDAELKEMIPANW